MGAYYGGSAFLNNTSAADASTVMNEGQQIAGAWQSFLSDNYNQPPDNTGCLTGGATCGPNNGSGPQYLANIPNYPAAAGTVPAGPVVIVYYGNPKHYYALADVGAPGANANSMQDTNATACYKILKTASGYTGGLAANTPDNLVSTAAAGNGTFGCSPLSDGGTAITGSAIPATMVGAGHYVMIYKLS
jgi:hypothetical protein